MIAVLIALLPFFALFVLVLILIAVYAQNRQLKHITQLLERQQDLLAVPMLESETSFKEKFYFSHRGVLVTNRRLVVPPYEWSTDLFRPVKVELLRGTYRINLLDKSGRQIHYLESDSQERINAIAKAINTALES